MALEQDLRALLADLVADQFFPDETPPSGYTLPCMVWTGIGGRPYWYVEAEALPEHNHQRVRIAIWAKSRDEANALMDEVELRLSQSTILVVGPVGGRFTDSDDVISGRATIQDFGIWYKR